MKTPMDLQPTPEKILCSAIWYKEIESAPSKFDISGKPNVRNVFKGIVICGHRHYNCILTLIHLTGKSSNEPDCGEYEQGFLTSNNRFVDRKEAGKIAYEAGQTKELKETLFSEDLF